MALLIPAGFVQYALVIKHDLDPEPMIVTCGHDVQGALGTPAGDLDAIAGAWKNLLVEMTSDAVFTNIVGRYGTSTTGEQIVVDVVQNYRGGQTDNFLPQNTSVLVKKITNRGGRRGRGRMFFPYLTPATTVSEIGVLAAGLITNYNTRLNNVQAALNAIGGGPVLLHESTGTTPPGLPTPITDFQLSCVIATQRRRLRR